ncbi:AMP-binding protein [Rhodococcus sp. G-MC3]|uniref:AMP-binding protein n=1 Tax=Rhodococcus sp. G-MC3 TaxID=3046209 RepID=UPI0024BA48DE|nr:AMP-binding protein [Rhodococcus sp. G-MC3]MDJ0392202.1 AMP-binding protein [Rhodococcus sp. G-MC3]
MTELIADRIARSVRDVPDSVAVIDRRESVSYREFWSQVERSAAGMRGLRRVAVLPTSDVGSLVTVVAAMSAGVSVVLLHRHLLPEQYAQVIEVAGPGAVVASASQHRRMRRLGCTNPIERLDADGSHFGAESDSELLVGVTSGTTGEPKLFVRKQHSWAQTLDRSDEVFDVRTGDRISAPGALDHTHFLYGAVHGLTRGAAIDLRPAVDALGSGATHLYSVPTIAWDIARSGAGPFLSVREVLSSAARWPSAGREALQQVLPHASLVHFYGASELSFVSYDRGVEPAAGTLFDGVDVEVRGGIVHVRSDMLFDGYLTSGGVAGGPVDGWMAVGDRGSLDGRQLTLFGREVETLIRSGLNVELAPIEAAALAIPGITEAACVAIPDARMGEVPALAVVLDGDALSSNAIRRALRDSLPSPSMPAVITALAQLPRTARGKLDRQALGATFATERTAPSTTNQSVSAPLS